MTTTSTQADDLRVLIYCRVSFDKTRDARSVAEQEFECRRDAERRGWRVVDVLADNSMSATRRATKGRPGYDRAARMLAAGDADVLMCWAGSRAQRNLREYLDLRDLCASNGVLWSYSGRVFDLSSGSDRFSTGVDALVAEKAAEELRDAVLRDVEDRAREGKVHGPLPDPYVVRYDPTTGKAVAHEIDPERGPYIQEAVRRVLAGESSYSVARDFNARGFRTVRGHEWTGERVTRLIKTPSLAGLRKFRGETTDVTGQWPALITPEEHYRLVSLFSDPSRRTNKEGTRVRHQGTGVYCCGQCGSPLGRLTRSRADGSRQARYGCKRSLCVTRDADQVDAFVDAVVTRFLARDGVLDELAREDADGDVVAAREEVAKLTAKLEDLRRRVDAGDLDLDDYARFKKSWNEKLADAERRATPRWLPEPVHDVVGPDAAQLWANAPVSARRAILKSLFTVKVHRTSSRGKGFDASSIEVSRH